MADNEVNIVITAVDQASKTLQAVGKAFNMIAGTVKDVTQKYIDYGTQVQKIALFTGVSNEQTSRLIQLADDAFVSADTLQLAMKNMASKGLQPSAENLAKLSDQFRSLKDPVARSELLIKEFGRSSMEMSKIMELGGQKILEMNKNIEAGLIIDDAKQARIQASKQALDAFNDSVDAMKFEMADKLLTIFNQMPEPIKNATLALSMFFSPTNINSLIQFGILLKGFNLAETFTAIRVSLLGLVPLIGPVLALTAALTGLILLLKSEAGGKAITAAKQLMTMGVGGAAATLSFVTSGGNRNAANQTFASVGQFFGALPGRAAGGSVLAGHAYMVGENGPEPFIPGVSGRILPHSGMGATVINIAYSPTIGVMSNDELEKFGYLVEQSLRRRR